MPGIECAPWSVRLGFVASGGTDCPRPASHAAIAPISGSCSSPIRSARPLTWASVSSGATERTMTSAWAWWTIMSW